MLVMLTMPLVIMLAVTKKKVRCCTIWWAEEKPWMGQSKVFPSRPPCFKPTKACHTLSYHTIWQHLTNSTIQCQCLLVSQICIAHILWVVNCHLYWLCSIVRLQFSGVICSSVDHVLWYCGIVVGKRMALALAVAAEEATHCSNATKLW